MLFRSDAITSNVKRKELKKLVYNAKDDITTMFQDGLEKVIMGLTTMEEVLKTIDISMDEELEI